MKRTMGGDLLVACMLVFPNMLMAADSGAVCTVWPPDNEPEARGEAMAAVDGARAAWKAACARTAAHRQRLFAERYEACAATVTTPAVSEPEAADAATSAALGRHLDGLRACKELARREAEGAVLTASAVEVEGAGEPR